MLDACKEQVPLKSYFPKIRIDSANQILKNKERVTLGRLIFAIFVTIGQIHDSMSSRKFQRRPICKD